MKTSSTITRPARAIALSLLMSAVLGACGGGAGNLHSDAGPSLPPPVDPGTGGPGNPDNPDPGPGPNPTPVTTGLLETTLGGTGSAVDNILPVTAGDTLGGIGKALDPTLAPVVDMVTGLTQQVGAASGLGVPVDNLLTNVGGAVAGKQRRGQPIL